MSVVMFDLRVVAPHDTRGASDFTGLDGVDQRVHRTAEGLDDRFHGKSTHGRNRLDRNKDLAASCKIFDGLLNQNVGHLHGVFRVKFPVFHSRELCLVTGADHFRMVASGHGAKGGHDALIIHQHHVDGSGGENQFCHQMVARHGDAPAHEQLVPGAADPGQVDA